LLGAAHQEYKSGNYKQALQHCTLVHEKSPQRTDALLLLGAIYYQVSWHVSSKQASSDCCIASCGVLGHICLSSELSSCSMWRKFLEENTRMDNSLKNLWGCFWWLSPGILTFVHIMCSCVTLTCALSRMKRQFALSPNLLNAMAIWQMLSRCISWILMGQRMLYADAALWHVYFSYGLVKPQS
jgi:hypothetical protein